MTPTPEIFQKNGMIARRMHRYNENKWQAAKSWFGGKPSINSGDWPRSEDTGLPLHHLAQISLAELPQGPWSDSLPKGGALCFFLNTDIEDDVLDSKILYVVDAEQYPPANPPADCPPIGGNGWFFEKLHRSAFDHDAAQKTLPCWPMEFAPSSFEQDPNDEYAVLIEPPLEETLGPQIRNVHIFHTAQPDVQPNMNLTDDDVFPWDAARRVLASLKSTGRRIQPVQKPKGVFNKIGSRLFGSWIKRRQEEKFHNIWQTKVNANDPYSLMDPETVRQFEKDLSVLRRETGISTRFGSGTTTVRDAASDAYKAMLIGSRKEYEAIPRSVRDFLETKRQRSGYNPNGRHQVFGIGNDIQGQVSERNDEILLFQADTDDMMSWMWGDVGVLQFWIKPEDLVSLNWDAVEGTFGGH